MPIETNEQTVVGVDLLHDQLSRTYCIDDDTLGWTEGFDL